MYEYIDIGKMKLLIENDLELYNEISKHIDQIKKYLQSIKRRPIRYFMIQNFEEMMKEVNKKSRMLQHKRP